MLSQSFPALTNSDIAVAATTVRIAEPDLVS
jgi:hypothetical protein